MTGGGKRWYVLGIAPCPRAASRTWLRNPDLPDGAKLGCFCPLEVPGSCGTRRSAEAEEATRRELRGYDALMPFTPELPSARTGVRAPKGVARGVSGAQQNLNHTRAMMHDDVGQASPMLGFGARDAAGQALAERQIRRVRGFFAQNVETSSAVTSSPRMVSVVKNGSPYRVRIIAP